MQDNFLQNQQQSTTAPGKKNSNLHKDNLFPDSKALNTSGRAGFKPASTPLTEAFSIMGKRSAPTGSNSTTQMKTTNGPVQQMVDAGVKEEENKVQMKSGGAQQSAKGSSASQSENLPPSILGKMEGAFDTSFSDVKVHSNSPKATGMGALAYAQGNDIHFAPGQYNPSSIKGQELIGHELTHVVQQRQGRVKATTQAKGTLVNDDPRLEKEADEMGKKAAFSKKIGADSGTGLEKVPAIPNSLIQKKNDASTRKLECNQPKDVKVGTSLTYELKQYGEELWSGDSVRTFSWNVTNSHGTQFVSRITDEPVINLVARNPGTYSISLDVLNNGTPVEHMSYSYEQHVYHEKKDTELGELSVGNFDFKYDGSKAEVLVRVKFDFEDGIANQDHQPFKTKFFTAVQSYWGNHGRSIEGTSDTGAKFTIPINITCQEVTDSSYHKLIDVAKDRMRPKVISDVNLYLNVSKETIAHEFGHVLGLYDEYDGGFWENIMFWHDNDHQSDTSALMNSGGGLRDRYFDHYMEEVESTSPAGYTYKIK